MNFTEFKLLRNKVNHMRRKRVKEFNSEAFKEKQGDMRGTWDLVNNVLKGKRNHRDECQNLLEEGHEISDG